MEVELHWNCAYNDAEQQGLSLGEGLRVYVDTQMQRLVLERRYQQYGLCGMRSVPLVSGDPLALRMFVDRSSAEVFVSDGQACISSRIYPDADRRELILFSWHGTAILSDTGVWQAEQAMFSVANNSSFFGQQDDWKIKIGRFEVRICSP